MTAVTITSFGHSCFRISAGNASAVLDPYDRDSVPGINLPEGIEASAVYCSHGHGDHNAAHLIKETAHGSDPFRAQFLTVPHDEAGGTLRGMNRITILKAGEAVIVHMGDIGRLPTEDEYEQLSKADVLLIPCGGHYTIDARQAAEIVRRIGPKLTILMHFRKGNRGYGVIADIETVKESFPELKCLDESSLTFEDTEIPQGVITLEPEQ
jgi:L-ascorbate metabolism protein UlaG (beta-lactamase superfamily)